MEARLHAWNTADDKHANDTLQQLIRATDADTLRDTPAAVSQQLLTSLLQASLRNAPVPTAVAAQATQYKQLLDRLWHALLVALPLDARSFALFESVIAAHTPAANTGANSRRSSLRPDGAAAAAAASSSSASQTHSRRGSLAPVEDQSIATIRQLVYQFAFEFVQMRAKQGTNAAATFPAELNRPARALFVRGVTDMWSAIRKTSATALARSAFVSQLADADLQELFDTLMQLALGEVSSNTGSSSMQTAATKPQWQVQEGAVLGISSLLACIRQRQTAAPSRALPAFLSTDPSRFYPLLAHAQLSVREYTCAVLRDFIELQPASQSTLLRRELIATLMRKLDADHWLSDYESEGILSVFHALGLPFDAASVSVLDRYLSHSASSVRQLVAEVLAKLALAEPTASAAAGDSSSSSSSSQATPSSFFLPEFLASDWEWERSEAEAALAARSSPLLGDMHTAAVFFVIPPPLYDSASTIASALSRRSSLNPASAPPTPSSSHARSGFISIPSSPSHHAMAAAAGSSSASGALLPSNYRSSWQWKEGALMCLELWLRAVAPTMDTEPRVQSAAVALGRLFSQVVRAASSWSWELRRMAEQVRTPFLAVWLRVEPPAEGPLQAGREIIRLCQQWMNEPATAAATAIASASTSPSLRPAAHPPVSLSAAVSTALCLHLVLSHLHRVQSQSSSGGGSKPAQDHQTTERKWTQDVDQLRVHPAVRQALSKHLPALLTRLEQLVVSTQLTMEHNALSTPALSSSPTTDNLAGTISAATPAASTTAPLVSWEQFTSLSLQVLVAAHSLKGDNGDGSFLQVSDQCKLQHYQCVLDRLRVIRSLCLGEEVAPSLSIAAQMPQSPPLSPVRASQLHSAHTQLLPSFAGLLHSTVLPLAPSLSHKLVVLRRARAKRLESWLIGHLAPQLPAFTGAVPAAAHVDLLDLLHDYLARYHKAAAIEVRQALLKSISVGWLRMGEVNQPLWSHQLHQLQEASLALLLQLLPEHTADRSLIVAALTVLVTSTPIHSMQLQELLTTIAKLVADEYEDVSLLAPPPDPASLLSPTSAAAAAEVEAWDDWDEDESDGTAVGGVNAAAGASAFDNFVHARQLVVDVSPLLSLLESLSFSATPVTASPIRAPQQAHAQSSLAQLVAAYETESTAAKPDASRQMQLLQWIQQWASQAHTQMEMNLSASASSLASASSSSSSPAAARLSSHHPMPINLLLQETRKGLSSALQSKLRWVQEQAKLLNEPPPSSAQELLRGNSEGAASVVPAGLHFSHATEADLPSLVEFAIASNDSHHTRTAPRSTAAAIFALDPAQARSNLVEIARDAQGTLVGFTALKFDVAKQNAPHSNMHLTHLFVAPTHHKRGIGRCLFHRAVSLARSLGCSDLRWVSDPDARGFYEKMGAQWVGHETNQLNPAQPVSQFKMELKAETTPHSEMPSAMPGPAASSVSPAAPAAAAAAAAPAAPPTRVLCLRGLVSPADLSTDAAFQDLLDDVSMECARFGTLRQVLIPRPHEAEASDMPPGETVTGVGRVFLEYSSTEESQRAFAALQGRFFAGVQIAAGFWDEGKFARRELDDETKQQAQEAESSAAAAGTKRARD